MPRHMLKLFATLTILAVAPAAAERLSPVAGAHKSACPHERARAAAAIAWAAPAPKAAATRITLKDRLPADGLFFGIGRGSGLLSP